MPSYRSREAEAFLEETRAALAQSRERFRQGVAATLLHAQQLAETFELAVGEVSAEDALDAWRLEFITQLHDALGDLPCR
jgi:hydroxypyruvate isomerase